MKGKLYERHNFRIISTFMVAVKAKENNYQQFYYAEEESFLRHSSEWQFRRKLRHYKTILAITTSARYSWKFGVSIERHLIVVNCTNTLCTEINCEPVERGRNKAINFLFDFDPIWDVAWAIMIVIIFEKTSQYCKTWKVSLMWKKCLANQYIRGMSYKSCVWI